MKRTLGWLVILCLWITSPALAAGFPIRPVLDIRGGWGFFHPNYGTYSGTYAGLLTGQLNLKINLAQPYLSLDIPAIFEALWGTRGTPMGYGGMGGVGLRLEPWPRITFRPYLGAAALLGYGTDGQSIQTMAYGAYAEGGLAIGKVMGVSFLATYRARWMPAGAWRGLAHEIQAGITFPIGR